MLGRVRDAADERLVYSFEIPRSLGGLHDFPPGYDWQEIDGAVPKAVRVTAAIRDSGGSIIEFPEVEIVAPMSVDVRAIPAPYKSSELDALVADGIYEIRFQAEARSLYLNIPGSELVWPAAYGFGAIVEGLDKNETTVFSIRVSKKDGVDIFEELSLTSRLSVEQCDSVTHLRITSDLCFAAVTMPHSRAWEGKMVVALQPMHIPFRRPAPGIMQDDGIEMQSKWIFPHTK